MSAAIITPETLPPHNPSLKGVREELPVVRQEFGSRGQADRKAPQKRARLNGSLTTVPERRIFPCIAPSRARTVRVPNHIRQEVTHDFAICHREIQSKLAGPIAPAWRSRL